MSFEASIGLERRRKESYYPKERLCFVIVIPFRGDEGKGKPIRAIG